MRPALVWGWTRYPSRSRATISERTVAEETCDPGALATWEEPTGWAVPMYSVTTASRMAARPPFRARSSPARSAVGTESRGGVMGAGTQVYRVPGTDPWAAPGVGGSRRRRP